MYNFECYSIENTPLRADAEKRLVSHEIPTGLRTLHRDNVQNLRASHGDVRRKELRAQNSPTDGPGEEILSRPHFVEK